MRVFSFIAVALISPLVAGTDLSSPVTRDDRVRGSFLGLAYGDAYGRLTRGMKRHQIERVYGDEFSPGTPRSAHEVLSGAGKTALRRSPLIGLGSGPTAQAMALLLAWHQFPSWDGPGPRYLARLLVSLYSDRSDRDVDRKYAQAIKRLARGVDPRQSGSWFPGLDTAARAGGLEMGREDTESVHRSSDLMTTSDHSARMLRRSLSFGNAQFLGGSEAAPARENLSFLLEALEPSWIEVDQIPDEEGRAPAFSTALRKIFDGLAWTRSNEEVTRLVVEAAREQLKVSADVPLQPNAGHALLGGLHALALALRDDAAPRATLDYIVRLGGESAMVGAIAGSLLGARFGSGWIPLDTLVDRARLERYADGLKTGRLEESAPEFLARERELTNMERAHQRRQLVACGFELAN